MNPEPRVNVPVAVDDAPVRVSRLDNHQLAWLALTVGLVVLLGACGVAAALVVTGLIQVSWAYPAGVGAVL